MTPADPTFAAIVADALHAAAAEWVRTDAEWCERIAAAILDDPRFRERLARAAHLTRHNHSGLPASADETCRPTPGDYDLAAAIIRSLRETP